MLSPTRIEKHAEAVLKTAKITRPSVDVRRVARSLGLKVRFEATRADVSGALFRRGTTAIIGVNDEHPESRQRFTIAHEIGHFILHHEDLFMDDAKSYPQNEVAPNTRLFRDEVSSQAIDPKEIEANRFAAALLMPAAFLKDSLRSLTLPLTQEDIEGLASEYEVSTQAMVFRLANLGVPIDVST